MNKKIIRIILLISIILLCTVIFYFSHQSATKSSNTSSGFTDYILELIPLNKELKLGLQSFLKHSVRKIAHFSLYTLLGILSISFITTYNLSSLKKILISSVFGILYGISDEIHQYFIPGRSCEIRDVIIDSAGVIFGIIIFMLIYHKIRKKLVIK
ncbi:MAG: VanZ family protein [Bacilli bacterium]|nr:VanZ family protein [Bacilli bacterium]